MSRSRDLTWVQRALSPNDPDRLLAEYRRRPLNFDATKLPQYTADRGWHIDDYCAPLLPEAPGPPVPGGSFEIAQRLMRGYEFADPSIVRAHYDPDEPLLGRTMVLELNFKNLLRFHSGTRVTGVHDDLGERDGRPVRIWGWDYTTLAGHLESGQMDWRVWKWLDTGEVQFRIHSVARRSKDPNLIVRLGFRLFGRREQVAFVHSTLARMQRLVEAALRDGEAGVEEASRVHTARARDGGSSHERLAENVRHPVRG